MDYLNFLASPLFWQSYLGIGLLSINFAIIGTTLIEKKMSLFGDTFSHAILPGVVIAGILGGSSLLSLLLGGWLSGFLLMAVTLLISKFGNIRKDSSFAFMSVFFISIGMILSFKFQTSTDLLHLLFGNLFVFDQELLSYTFGLTLVTLGVFYFSRNIWSLWILDPSFPLIKARLIGPIAVISLLLFVTHLTLGLYSLGTLMAVGLLIIPSLFAQKFYTLLYSRIIAATVFSFISHFFGLSISFLFDLPIGPSLILSASLLFIFVCLLFLNYRRVPA